MNPSTACGRTVVDELVALGVRDAVLSPGSRSAPLALALHAADRAGRLRLHVRVDERTAGFLALGLAKASGRPVPVVTTSGTAAANLHPAVLEGSHAGVALVAVTADRPARLRNTGANQTTDQVRLFGSAARAYEEVAATAGADQAGWRATVDRAVAAALGTRSADPGPVQLNVALDEPLVADEALDWPAEAGDVRPWTDVAPAPAPGLARLPLGPRTVVVAGDSAGPAASRLAEAAGWPLLAEPSSGARCGRSALRAYRLILEHSALAGQVERVVAYGHPTLSRPVTRLLSRAETEVIAVVPRGRWSDVGSRVRRVVAAAEPDGTDDPEWLSRWQAADAAAGDALDQALARSGWTPFAVASAVWDAVPPAGLLVVGSSNPVRDLDLVARPSEPPDERGVLANRGLSGIDGTVSTAVGAALACQGRPALAYLGDLAFLHDANGLLVGPGEPRPDLTIVVANDDGGGIFALLEPGAPAHAAAFERVFGTPTGADLGALCAATRTPHSRVTDAEALAKELAEPPAGIRVVEAVLDRTGRRDLESRLLEASRRALGAG